MQGCFLPAFPIWVVFQSCRISLRNSIFVCVIIRISTPLKIRDMVICGIAIFMVNDRIIMRIRQKGNGN